MEEPTFLNSKKQLLVLLAIQTQMIQTRCDCSVSLLSYLEPELLTIRLVTMVYKFKIAIQMSIPTMALDGMAPVFTPLIHLAGPKKHGQGHLANR
jgi:hypothetical protein